MVGRPEREGRSTLQSLAVDGAAALLVVAAPWFWALVALALPRDDPLGVAPPGGHLLGSLLLLAGYAIALSYCSFAAATAYVRLRQAWSSGRCLLVVFLGAGLAVFLLVELIRGIPDPAPRTPDDV